MAQEGRHIFSKEEGGLGARNSRLSRKAWLRFEKKLAELNLEKETVSKVLELAKVVISQPGGVFLIGWLIIDGLERIGYFGSTGGSAPATPGATSTTPPVISPNGGFTQNFLAIFESLPGGQQFVDVLSGVSGFVIPGSTLNKQGVNNPAGGGSGAADAAFLKTGLFAICLTQALGGGQGIATLGTAALAALK